MGTDTKQDRPATEIELVINELDTLIKYLASEVTRSETVRDRLISVSPAEAEAGAPAQENPSLIDALNSKVYTLNSITHRLSIINADLEKAV
jgi:hypothetical protein